MAKSAFTPLSHPFPSIPAQPADNRLVREIMAQLAQVGGRK